MAKKAPLFEGSFRLSLVGIAVEFYNAVGIISQNPDSTRFTSPAESAWG